MDATAIAQFKNRIYVLMGALLVVGLLLTGRLVQWQIIEHPQFVTMAAQSHQNETIIQPERGEIRDSNGYLLAMDVIEYDISASPTIISKPTETAQKLGALLGLSVDELTRKLSTDAAWTPLAKSVSQAQGETIIEWDIVGIKAESRTRRMYPENELAAHTLGFVNSNGTGFYGVEGRYDEMLRGQPGRRVGEHSPFGEVIPVGASSFHPAVSGPTLHLTLNRNVQYQVEQELARSVKLYDAQRGSVIVMNPKTGALLGLANFPTYNPNEYGATAEELYKDPLVSEQYEPGSVFKIVTMGAGLDANMITPDLTMYDNGQLELGGRTFENWDRQAHGMVSMTDVLARSLNVGSAQVAVALGRERFYTYVKRFGFGRLTEVDLGNEGPGTLKTPQSPQWHTSDLGANAFGQGIAVTPMQIASAVCAVANKGMLMKPHIVQQIIQADGTQLEVQPQPVRRAISEESATTLTDMLVEGLVRSNSKAQVPGYEVAGKTGTAEIPIPGGYHPTLTLASFAGYLPADDPELMILVIFDRPTTSRWGGQTAAPTFRRLAQQLVVLLDIPPDQVRVAATNQ